MASYTADLDQQVQAKRRQQQQQLLRDKADNLKHMRQNNADESYVREQESRLLAEARAIGLDPSELSLGGGPVGPPMVQRGAPAPPPRPRGDPPLPPRGGQAPSSPMTGGGNRLFAPDLFSGAAANAAALNRPVPAAAPAATAKSKRDEMWEKKRIERERKAAGGQELPPEPRVVGSRAPGGGRFEPDGPRGDPRAVADAHAEAVRQGQFQLPLSQGQMGPPPHLDFGRTQRGGFGGFGDALDEMPTADQGPPPPPSELDQLHSLGDQKFGRQRLRSTRPLPPPQPQPPQPQPPPPPQQQQQYAPPQQQQYAPPQQQQYAPPPPQQYAPPPPQQYAPPPQQYAPPQQQYAPPPQQYAPPPQQQHAPPPQQYSPPPQQQYAPPLAAPLALGDPIDATRRQQLE